MKKKLVILTITIAVTIFSICISASSDYVTKIQQGERTDTKRVFYKVNNDNKNVDKKIETTEGDDPIIDDIKIAENTAIEYNDNLGESINNENACDKVDAQNDVNGTQNEQNSLSYEYQILSLINKRRADNGLRALKMDSTLCTLASVRAQEASISWSHTRPNGEYFHTIFYDYGVNNYVHCGENLAYNYESADEYVNAWMDSAEHRNNILNPEYEYTGIAIYVADNGYEYVEQLFAY